MTWFDEIHARLAPRMARAEFNRMLNDIETRLFDRHSEYLELPEEEQNLRVEEAIRREYGSLSH